MADPLAAAAGIVGLVVPALHGARLLLDDLEKITDAPKVVKGLEDDLTSVSASLESLKVIEDPQWDLLGGKVVERSKAAIAICATSCDAMRGDLQRWTRRSRDGKLSWRDRAKIGFFKERRVKSMSEQMQSCKLTISSVVGVATFYGILRNTAMTEAIKKELAARQRDMTAIVRSADAQVASVEQSLSQLRLADEEDQSEQEEEDAITALSAVEAELATLQGLRETMKELMSQLQAEKMEQLASRAQPGSIYATFGANNSGFQLASNAGSINGLSFRQR